MDMVTRTTCRLCKSPRLKKVIDFGLMPLAGGFLEKKNIPKEKMYPLRVSFCEECSLLQILDVVSPKILFQDYRYASSITKTLSEHFQEYAKEMTSQFLQRRSFVVEIGANDGVLLAPLKELGIKNLGVDPAVNITKIARVKGVPVLNEFFRVSTARKIIQEYGQADAIFSNNTLAHIDDMDEVFCGVKLLLKKTGILIFEVQYLGDLVKDLQYEFFCHEHLCYYSLGPLMRFLEKYAMKVFDIRKVPIHGGSIRIYAAHSSNATFMLSPCIYSFLEDEKRMDLYSLDTFSSFAEKTIDHKRELVNLIARRYGEGKVIAGYGASGRSVTLTNYCGIDRKYLKYMVDASPERYGRFMPGTHIKIVSPPYFRMNPPDVLLITAWTYKDEILGKEKWFLEKGGEVIIPFPRPTVFYSQSCVSTRTRTK